MRIGWGYVESPLGGSAGVWGATLGAVAPKGTLFGVNLITFHVVSAFVMLLVAGVYVGYLFRSRASRRLQMTSGPPEADARDPRGELLAEQGGPVVREPARLLGRLLHDRGAGDHRRGALPARLGLATVLGGYETVRLVHGIVAYMLLPYTIVHAILQWVFGRFWSIFKAQFYQPHLRAGLVSLAIVLPVIAGLYLWNEVPETLTVVHAKGDFVPRSSTAIRATPRGTSRRP